MIIPDTNPLFTTSSDVKAICMPMFDLLGICYLSFYRVYEEGKRIRLTTHPEWAQHYYKSESYKYGQLDRHPKLYESGIALWDHWPKDALGWINVGKIAFDDFKLGHGFSVVKQQGSFMDVFEFMTYRGRDDINNIYLRYLDYIYKFIDYFYSQSYSLIKKCEGNPLVVPGEGDFFLQADESGLLKGDEMYLLSFLEKDRLREENPHLQNLRAKLTPKQLDCFDLLKKGYSNKKIAQHLGKSPRTIEAHVSQIMHKLGVGSRQYLID